MTGRLLWTAIWLLVAHAALVLIYWGLLNVPESNIGTLATSALLVSALVVGAAAVQGNAVLALGTKLPWRTRQRRAFLSVAAFVVAVLLWLAFAWAAARLGRWHTAHAGEIDAWFIATFSITRTAWVHRGIVLALAALRDVIGISIAVGAFVTGTLAGVSDVLRLRWLPRALGPRRLLTVAVAFGLLIWLPWQVSTWRPASLTVGPIEPTFAVVKLGLIALLAHVGWTLILWSAVPRAVPETPPGDARRP